MGNCFRNREFFKNAKKKAFKSWVIPQLVTSAMFTTKSDL